METPSLQQLLEAGVHFGHQVRRGNPRMKQFIYGAKEGVHVIDLTLTDKYLKQAVQFLYELGKSGGSLMLVGSKKQARPIIIGWAKRLNLPYVSEKWVGGLFTNFEEISKNIKRLKDLKSQKEKGELSKYTKKEQLMISRKIAKLEKNFGGVQDMPSLPSVIFVIDTVTENTAVVEANRKKVVVVAIVDSNSDPALVDYPVPGNDDAIKSITILTDALLGAFEEGLKSAEKVKKTEESKKSKEPKVSGEGDSIPVIDVEVAEELVEKQVVKESGRKI